MRRKKPDQIIDETIEQFKEGTDPVYTPLDKGIKLSCLFWDSPMSFDSIDAQYGSLMVAGFTGGICAPLTRKVFNAFDAMRDPIIAHEEERNKQGANDLIKKVKRVLNYDYGFRDNTKLEHQIRTATTIIEENPEYLEFAADKLRNMVNNTFRMRHLKWKAMLQSNYTIPDTNEQLFTEEDKRDLLGAINGNKYLTENERRAHSSFESTLDLSRILIGDFIDPDTGKAVPGKKHRVIEKIEEVLDKYDAKPTGAIDYTRSALRKLKDSDYSIDNEHQQLIDSIVEGINADYKSPYKKDSRKEVARKIKHLSGLIPNADQKEIGINLASAAQLWDGSSRYGDLFEREDRALAEIRSVLVKNKEIVERYGSEIFSALKTTPRRMGVITDRKNDLESMLLNPNKHHIGNPQEKTYLVITGITDKADITPKDASRILSQLNFLQNKYGDDLKLVLGTTDLEAMEKIQWESDKTLTALYEKMQTLPVAVNVGDDVSILSDYIEDHVPAQELGRDEGLFRTDVRLCVSEEVNTSGKKSQLSVKLEGRKKVKSYVPKHRTSDEKRYDLQTFAMKEFDGSVALHEVPLVILPLGKAVGSRSKVRSSYLTNYLDGRRETHAIQENLSHFKGKYDFVSGFCKYVQGHLQDHMSAEQVAESFMSALENIQEEAPTRRLYASKAPSLVSQRSRNNEEKNKYNLKSQLPSSLRHLTAKKALFLEENLDSIAREVVPGVYGMRVQRHLKELLYAKANPPSIFD